MRWTPFIPICRSGKTEKLVVLEGMSKFAAFDCKFKYIYNTYKDSDWLSEDSMMVGIYNIIRIIIK